MACQYEIKSSVNCDNFKCHNVTKIAQIHVPEVSPLQIGFFSITFLFNSIEILKNIFLTNPAAVYSFQVQSKVMVFKAEVDRLFMLS